MKTKEIKIKKDQWVLIAKNTKDLKIDFPDFKKCDYRVKFGEDEIDIKTKTFKLSGKKKIDIYCKGNNDSIIVVSLTKISLW